MSEKPLRRVRLWQTALLSLACTFWSATADAHFIWVYQDGGTIKLVFGEGLEPDRDQFLDGLSELQAWSVADGAYKPAQLVRISEGDTGWLEMPVSAAGNALDIHCPYGVFGRGDGTMFLDYAARYVNLSATAPAGPNDNLPLCLVPQLEEGRMVVTALVEGKPAAGIEITVLGEDRDRLLETDDRGKVALQLQDRMVLRAKQVVEQAGQIDGQAYSQKNFYCTLVVDSADIASHPAPPSPTSPATIAMHLHPVDAGYPELPLGMTSLGAARAGDSIYVIGGKQGRAHAYARDWQNRDVFQLNTESASPEWKTVSENHGLQGLAVVSHGGKLYRIGGLEARNEIDAEHDLHSVPDFVAFDPQTGQWSELPDLPEPRSSFDACLAGDTIYVVGGWTMAGTSEPAWCTHGHAFDLANPDAGWQSFAVPFRTRAMAVRPLNNRLYVMGGIEENGGPTNAVHVMDLETRTWSAGAALPTDGGMQGFGCAAATMDGRLLTSTYDGGVFCLNQAGDGWEKIHQLETGRFFHQMVPLDESRLALVGGAQMESGRIQDIEVLQMESGPGNGTD